MQQIAKQADIDEAIQIAVSKGVKHALEILKPKKQYPATMRKTETILKNFPAALNELKNKAGTLSEGEQQSMQLQVSQVSRALQSIADDPYYDIIRFRYFREMPWVEIADRLEMSESSVRHNKNRLVKLLSIRLFTAEVISNMWAGV